MSSDKNSVAFLVSVRLLWQIGISFFIKKKEERKKKRGEEGLNANIHLLSKCQKSTELHRFFQQTSHILDGMFSIRVIRKYYHSMTIQFHQGTSQSAGCEPHTTDGKFGAVKCILRVLLTGYCGGHTESRMVVY